MVALQLKMVPVSFVGDGALLLRAIKFCMKNKIQINKIFVPHESIDVYKCYIDDLKIISFKKNLSEMLVNNLNEDDFLFSINNKFIIEDAPLIKIKNVYNIHNGLVQQYRGLGELCVFSAYLRKEKKYGATFHKINPKQEPDSGEIYAQKSFYLRQGYSFQEIMTQSIRCCQDLFEENIINIINKNQPSIKISNNQLGKIYTYKNIGNLIKKSKNMSMNLGVYEKDFYKIKETIDGLI
mgnify:CR=1 FL=1|tara:strand:- start:3022 stop:3735 length:714 start_codon:yes stop_codon:yes gene_type:complete